MALSSAHFGGGIGDIYFDNVGCIGTESNLLDCSYISNADCSHSEDAGVRCQCETTLTNEYYVHSIFFLYCNSDAYE